jgi:dTDP-4-dehydrorhamnose 3,5-epimerase
MSFEFNHDCKINSFSWILQIFTVLKNKNREKRVPIPFFIVLLQNNMEYKETDIKGVWVIEPKVFNDARGYFFEAWKKEEFESHIGSVNFVQDNESKSSRGVLRGLHYQKGEFSQAKLVRVISGTVIDVAVDIRRSSPTFGRYVAVELSAENKRQLFIPRGMAHGFLVLSDEAVFTYKVDNVYAPQAEASIRFDDPTIGIEWPIDPAEMLLSPKDQNGKSLQDAELFE